MSVIYTPRKPEANGRMIAMLGTIYGLLAILFLRLWYFQVVKAPILVERAEASRAEPVLQLAPRGLIVDRDGRPVAGIKREIVIKATPKELTGGQDEIDRVIALLKTDSQEKDPHYLERKVMSKLAEAKRTPYVASPIYVGAGIDSGTRIAEAPDEFPGLSVDTLPMRSYAEDRPESQGDPIADCFTHVLGYVWLRNENDIKRIKKQGFDPAEYVGKSGIEKAYEQFLMGVPGAEHIEMDAKGRPLRLVGRDEATPGDKLVLTIDRRLQELATKEMTGKVGGLVAMDPTTGEVLSLVSTPTFDVKKFEGGMSDADWKSLSEDPDKPLLDRAIGTAMSPGSTFKIVTSLAAYETGKFDPHMTVDCQGGFYLNGRRICKCMSHHGDLQFKEAFEKSCNTYFATLGYEVGADALRKAALEVGLGERTGIEIDGERRGVVPTEHWLTHRKHPLSWHAGDTVNMSIGQGWVETTPLQMCNLVAMVANDGVNYRPHLVKEIVDPLNPNKVKTIQPEILHQVNAAPEFWNTLKEAMVGVIENGTASGYGKIPGIVWGGKTGSTEHGNKKLTKTHAWFVGIAPIDHPKIVICVLVESAGHGGDKAAPIAQAVVKDYLVDEPKSLANLSKAASKTASALTASAAASRSPSEIASR